VNDLVRSGIIGIVTTDVLGEVDLDEPLAYARVGFLAADREIPEDDAGTVGQ